jgi:hypothetical protein
MAMFPLLGVFFLDHLLELVQFLAQLRERLLYRIGFLSTFLSGAEIGFFHSIFLEPIAISSIVRHIRAPEDKKPRNRGWENMPLSLQENGTPLFSFLPPFIAFFPVTTLKLVGSTLSPNPIPHTYTHTSIKSKPSSTYSHPQHHLSIAIVTMPLEHVVTYEAFCEITNFIRNNGNNWGKFCHNTSCPLTTRKTVKTPLLSN